MSPCQITDILVQSRSIVGFLAAGFPRVCRGCEGQYRGHVGRFRAELVSEDYAFPIAGMLLGESLTSACPSAALALVFEVASC